MDVKAPNPEGEKNEYQIKNTEYRSKKCCRLSFIISCSIFDIN